MDFAREKSSAKYILVVKDGNYDLTFGVGVAGALSSQFAYGASL
jgi:hypothetical protein